MNRMFVNLNDLMGDGVNASLGGDLISAIFGRQSRGSGFDNRAYKEAIEIVAAENEGQTDGWDNDRWAEEILKVDPSVKGHCGSPTCPMDRAIRDARKRMDLFTDEERIEEAIVKQIPAIADAVASRLLRQLPRMMENAVWTANEKARRNAWWRRLYRFVAHQFVGFFGAAWYNNTLNEEFDEMIAAHQEEIQAHEMTDAKAKRYIVFNQGIAVFLGFYTGRAFYWLFTPVRWLVAHWPRRKSHNDASPTDEE